MRRHPEYYLEDGTVTLLVDECLFKVHRYYLARESDVFRDMFSLPPEPSASCDGGSDEAPIVIPEVSCAEFESFLGFIYFGMHDDHEFSLENWISLLSFATRFICDQIRGRAIREIEKGHSKPDPVERVVLAVKHNIPQWLVSAYQELCQRQNPLTEEEGEKLGLPTVIKLMKAREMLMAPIDRMRFPLPGMSSSSQHLLNNPGRRSGFFTDVSLDEQMRFEPPKVLQIVKQVFELE